MPSKTLRPRLTLHVFHNNPASTLATIEQIDSRGSALLDTYETYFDARYIYHRMRAVSPTHVVTMRAARLWYDAAYRLASVPTRCIAMDKGAVAANATLEAAAAADAAVGRLFHRITPKGYFREMGRNAKAFEWADVDLVPDLIHKGEIREAAEINSYYLSRFGDLSPTERQTLAVKSGITLDLLKANQEYLAALSPDP